ncbi:MAG: DUF930 domain-containing protein [Pseudomonadota bacterium]|nr:DUF930 domain-containing protein [Pseudomonadota bacterium]
MKDDRDDSRRVSRWALPGSLAAHLLVVLLIVFGLPLPLFEPEDEQAISVDLVPPPEEPEAEPPPPPEKPAEKPEDEAEEREAEPPPEGDEAAQAAALPVLRPVFQFGEKDAGPRQSLDGNSPEEGAPAPQADPEPENREAAGPQALSADAPNDDEAEPPPGEPETASPEPETEAEPELAQAPERQDVPKLKEAKRLFSRQATGDIIATTAMGAVPRGVRAGRLCVTELREQLQNGVPPYFPDLLPSYRLEEGTVIDAPGAAFRVAGRWYDLSYRCEVDADATRVVSFAMRVGRPIPPSEWTARKLPAR